MAVATSSDSTPSSRLTTEEAPLIEANAPIIARSIRSPEMGKLSTARCVCAPQRAAAGTRTSPMVSCSVRNSSDPMAPTYGALPMTDPAFTELLPLGPDDTPYRLLTTDGVATVDAAGRTFLEVAPAVLPLLARPAVHGIAHWLRP